MCYYSYTENFGYCYILIVDTIWIIFGTSSDQLTTCSKNDLIIKYLQIIFAEFNF